MPRRPREEEAGALHHVYARGNNRQSIYVDDRDRRTYLRLLEAAVGRFEWICLAYCLMDNHMHLLLETPRPNLGAGMQRLHGDYARAVNDRHEQSGHLFQGRFGAVRIRSDEQLLVTVAYIARNPIEAGYCSEPDRYRWSSCAATLHGRAPGWLAAARVLDALAPAGGDPLRRYAELVGSHQGSDPSLHKR
ncbi:MAG TPA: transposase [Solirubrobacteraceae bacterium]